MMNKYTITIAFVLVGLLSSCSDWLDVKPESEEREKDVFIDYNGFKEALSGCYTDMVERNLYGEKLTMTDVECLARLWAQPSQQWTPTQYYLYNYDYENTYSQTAIKDIYGGLFNVVAQANTILTHLEENGDVIKSRQARDLIHGEALAIRGLCQLDILRLFGQLPQGATKQVALPYAYKTGIHEIPSYYGFTDYVANLERDLTQAEALLRDCDPVTEYTFAELNGEEGGTDVDDDFLTFRRFRLNYWAVRGLKARLYLYTGQTTKAYEEAKAIIGGQIKGQNVVSLSGVADIAEGYYTLPDECLFALSCRELGDYNITLLGGSASARIDPNEQFHITTRMLDNQLYAGQNTTSNNRYLDIWEKNTASLQGTKYPTTRKYYYDPNGSYGNYADDLLTKRTKLQLIPMIRLSEIYLIAMETTPSLAEGNALYKTYMADRNVNITDDFESLEALAAEVVNEYRREFYAEGQMFYTYKRLNTERILWGTDDMTEQQYILPLPETEYVRN